MHVLPTFGAAAIATLVMLASDPNAKAAVTSKFMNLRIGKYCTSQVVHPQTRPTGKDEFVSYPLIAINCATAATTQITRQKALKAPQGVCLPPLA